MRAAHPTTLAIPRPVMTGALGATAQRRQRADSSSTWLAAPAGAEDPGPLCLFCLPRRASAPGKPVGNCTFVQPTASPSRDASAPLRDGEPHRADTGPGSGRAQRIALSGCSPGSHRNSACRVRRGELRGAIYQIPDPTPFAGSFISLLSPVPLTPFLYRLAPSRPMRLSLTRAGALYHNDAPSDPPSRQS
jgi:hypothetical protein